MWFVHFTHLDCIIVVVMAQFVSVCRTLQYSDRVNKNFVKQWKNDAFSDMKIVSNGREFPCHRFIIAASSAILKTSRENKQENAVQENGLRLNLDPIPTEVVEIVLDFIYSGKVDIPHLHFLETLKASVKLETEALIDV